MPVRYYTFDVVIEKEPEDDGYFAYSPTLPGCFSNGLSIEETRTRMREALEQHLATLIENGDDIPQRSPTALLETVSFAVPA